MNVKINIECETGAELLQHLAVILLAIEKKIEWHKSGPGAIRKPFVFTDNNCYGIHEAKISDFSFDELEFGYDLSKMDYNKYRAADELADSRIYVEDGVKINKRQTKKTQK